MMSTKDALAPLESPEAKPPFPSHVMREADRRGWSIVMLTARDEHGAPKLGANGNEQQIPVLLDRMGRPVPEPTKFRKNGRTTLPVGSQWLAHDRRGGRAAARRVEQLAKRGLRICGLCNQERPIEGPIDEATGQPTSPWTPVSGQMVCDHCLNAAINKTVARKIEAAEEIAAAPGTYGLVDVDRYLELGLRGTLLDGEDVALRCITADDRYGWALLQVLDGEGLAQLNPDRPDELLTELRLGRVAFLAPRDTTDQTETTDAH